MGILDHFSLSLPKIDEHNVWISKAESARQQLLSGNGAGSEFTGWLDLPQQIFDSGIVAKIEEQATILQNQGSVLVVVGIGGSYLGARAVIEALGGSWHNLQVLTGKKKGNAIFYSGHHIDAMEMENLESMLWDHNFSINVISKSGTTTEPGLAFRRLKQLAKRKYGNDYVQRVVATTDANKGALKKMADKESFASFVIPDDIGGRYSVLTPVGLLPIAAAGFSIKDLLQGAMDMSRLLRDTSAGENIANQYAALRNAMYHQGKQIEVLVSYLTRTQMLAEWWKQLFGESEGKQHKSLWPASVQFTTDLHSLGQWLQDGPAIFFETIVAWTENSLLTIENDHENLDNLNYLTKKTLPEINDIARQATQKAHESNAPIGNIYPGVLNPYNLGALLYFFEFSCAVSGYMLGVNPFDQPGVEFYKKNMFQMLGKPGF